MSNTDKLDEIVYIKINEVRRLTGLSTATIYRRMSESDFPKQVPLGKGCVRWVEAEVKAWVRKKMEQARQAA